MKTEKYQPDFTRIKCSWKLVLIHVYELTIENNDYVFTSIDIEESFGCHRSNANHMINRGKSMGDYSRDYSIKSKTHNFKITGQGKKRAMMLIKRQLEADNEDGAYGR